MLNYIHKWLRAKYVICLHNPPHISGIALTRAATRQPVCFISASSRKINGPHFISNTHTNTQKRSVCFFVYYYLTDHRTKPTGRVAATPLAAQMHMCGPELKYIYMYIWIIHLCNYAHTHIHTETHNAFRCDFFCVWWLTLFANAVSFLYGHYPSFFLVESALGPII